MRALIYTRVSTDEQAKTGFSLANQEKECKYFAEKNGYEVVKVYVEKGESGSTSKRTEFQKLIKYCLTHSKEIDALIVYKLDRFMRNLEEQITIINQFKKIGIRVLAVHDPNDDKTASGILMRNILGCFNQYENDLKSERVTAGMKEAFLQGNWQWRAPLGYKTVNKNITPDPKTAPIVKKIFELFKTGLYTQVQIISIIEKDGLTLNANHMSRLLQNPIYCGIMVKKEWSANPIKGNFEPLITEKTFYKVQNILSGRKPHIAPHLRNNPLFPLRQFITCPHCNQPLTGSSSTGRRKIKYNYYHCYNRDCGVNFRIPKDRLEENFMKYLKRIKPNKDLIELFKAIVKDVYNTSTKEHAETIKKLNKRLDEVQTRKSKLIDLYIAGKLDENAYKIKSDEYVVEEQNIKADIITDELPKDDFKNCLEYVCNAINNIETLWLNSDLDTKQRLQNLIFPKGLTYDLEKFRTPEKSCLFTIIGALSAPYNKVVPPSEFESLSTP